MTELPLNGLRVLDLTDGTGELCSRLLADLGADVIRVEPPSGSHSRLTGVAVDGVSMTYLVHNANKRSIVLDLAAAADLSTLWDLVDRSDVVVLRHDAQLDGVGITSQSLRSRRPSLVVTTISEFGTDGPYRNWRGSEQVHLALGGVLSRSGLPDTTPLLPPGSLADATAGTQAAWATLVSYLARQRTGAGQEVDVSVYETTAAVFDAGWGMGGSATGGVPAADGPRGRPDARHLYPIFACADGYVRMCILSGRQWQGMFRWLGEPEEFADPQLNSLMHRFMAADRIYPAIGTMCAALSRSQLEALGHEHGVPVGAVNGLGEVLLNEQFVSRHAFTQLDGGTAGTVTVPNGCIVVDGQRAGVRTPAAALGAHTGEVIEELLRIEAAPQTATGDSAPIRPLQGVRVLDLGVIVAGAELGRLLADMGADVLKLENKEFPDGGRQSLFGEPMTASFAWGHRNKRGVGLNLRDPRGKELFRQLAATSDVILSNFKPGTLESLGLGAEELLVLNPRLVLADSSAFGPTGPYSARMGYGPLVRATAGLTALWRYPEDPASFSDAATIYPDHVAARISALAVVAKLVQRERTGRGGTVSVAQAEIILSHLGDLIALESVQPGSVQAVGNALTGQSPAGVFPCAGDDEWVVVTVNSDADAVRLAHCIGRPDLTHGGTSAAHRLQGREQWESALAEWTATRSPRAAMEELQDAGVAAGAMQRVTEYAEDPHLQHREFFRTMHHPLVARELPSESRHAVFSSLPLPELRPAPLPGEHTRDVMAEILGLTDDEISRLLEEGVLEQAPAAQPVEA